MSFALMDGAVRRRGGLGAGLLMIVLAAVSPETSRTAARPDDAPAAAADWRVAAPGHVWEFPRDHWSHPAYRTEWWYFTGHLRAPASDRTGGAPRRFGYQFTFFRVGLVPDRPEADSSWATRDLVMGHASITDPDGGEHVFSEVLYRAIPLLGGFGAASDSTVAWSRAPAGTDARWTLTWTGDGFDIVMRDDAQGVALVLNTDIDTGPVLQGPDGYSRKGRGESAASLYYSYTRLATAGTLTVGGETHAVTGLSWMDREFGSNQLDDGQVGWDWLGLQLDDGRDLMLYHLRRADGTVDFARGSLTGPGGEVRRLRAGDWSWRGDRTWHSPATGAEYPVRWHLQVPPAGNDGAGGLILEIRPLLAAQENVSVRSGVHYWEGAVEALAPDGAVVGRGYVELTGYGEGSRPPI